MEDWDQDKLEQVVATKGSEYKNANKPTEIVSAITDWLVARFLGRFAAK